MAPDVIPTSTERGEVQKEDIELAEQLVNHARGFLPNPQDQIQTRNAMTSVESPFNNQIGVQSTPRLSDDPRSTQSPQPIRTTTSAIETGQICS